MSNLEVSVSAERNTPTVADVTTRAGIRVQATHLRRGILAVAGVLLVVSMFLPYWSITLHAPQYPKGLTVDAYVHGMTGDVFEVDGLNHYIGMMRLEDAATLERTIARPSIVVIALLIVVAGFVRGRWRWVAVAPAIAYPVVFAADLFAWLYYAGHSLDPTAALSSSIKPFTPAILGTGVIGQFHTVARFDSGFYLAVLAVVLAVGATLRRGERGHETR